MQTSKEMIDAVLSGKSPGDIINEQIANERKLWVKTVKTEWEPPEDLFTKSAAAIAKGLAVAPDLRTAMSRLVFYINRAGKKLSPERLSVLNTAKEKLRKMYT